MAPTLRATKLTRLRTVSQEMLALAQVQDWDALAKLETERSTLMNDIFSVPFAPAEAGAAAVLIREVLDLDARVVEFVTAHRRELGAQLGQLARGRNAHLAYTEA